MPRVATSQEMQVVLTLVDSYRAGDKARAKYNIGRMPIWSRMLPLHVLRTNDRAEKHPSFPGFAIPIKTLVDDAESSIQGFALKDSTHLFQQVCKAEILLDTTAFKPDNLITPHLYKQPQVRRKVHGYWFYRFSQPLFSPDGNSAYIQADIAGSRESYKLSKKQGRWVITHSALLWVE